MFQSDLAPLQVGMSVSCAESEHLESPFVDPFFWGAQGPKLVREAGSGCPVSVPSLLASAWFSLFFPASCSLPSPLGRAYVPSSPIGGKTSESHGQGPVLEA